MSLAEKLAEERRARLAAERLLDQKRRELTEANRKLGLHARELTHEICETRARVATVEHENSRVRSALGEANEKIALVEGQLWQALGAMRDGFALWSAAGRLELANRAYLSIFDGIGSAGVGAHYGHLIDLMIEEGIADLEGASPEAWRHMVREGWEAEPLVPVTLRLWDSSFIKILNRRTPDGGIVSLVVDMTDLMRMWSAVQELPDGFVLYDAEDRLVTCNERYRAVYRTSAPAMVPGAHFEDILRYGLERGQYADAIGREEEWLAERMRQHLSSEVELEQQLDDGSWLRIFETGTSDGGRVGLRIDITQQKRVQHDLERATERAEAASHAKSAFLANMSHEIRTPMNGVVGMTDLLMETELSEEQRIFVETIRHSGEALLVIINDVLDYSKIEAGKMVLRAAPFDLERVIHEVFMLLQPTARDKEIVLVADYDMFLPTRFVGDAARLRQVLINLVGNAVKFTARGRVVVRVVGVPEPDGRVALHVTVEDTGIGISAERQADVFGEFTQVEHAPNRQFEGTGLGLSITRRLVALMGGEMWLESEPGQGSCFGVRLVLEAVEAAEGEVPCPPPGLRHVLVVKGNATNRAILSKQLRAAGLACRACRSAEEALAAPADWDVALVSQDLAAPGWADLARRLGAMAPGRPVILLSPDGGAGIAGGDRALVRSVVRSPAPRRALFAALAGLDTSPPEAPEEGAGVVTFRSRRGMAAEPPSVPRPLDILVAEDNRTNQLVFRKMVAERGDKLRFAANGFEAVAAYEARRPDLIFMDISMPGMDGREATRLIRAREAPGSRVPIVAVTAHALDGDREAVLEAGLDDYLTKPLRKAALLSMIDRHRPADPPPDQADLRMKAGRSGAESSAS